MTTLHELYKKRAQLSLQIEQGKMPNKQNIVQEYITVNREIAERCSDWSLLLAKTKQERNHRNIIE